MPMPNMSRFRASKAIAIPTRPVVADQRDRIAMLFTVSKKEVTIAAAVVFASGLPAEIALPAIIDAVVQLVTLPVVANAVARHASQTPPTRDDGRSACTGRRGANADARQPGQARDDGRSACTGTATSDGTGRGLAPDRPQRGGGRPGIITKACTISVDPSQTSGPPPG